MTKPTQPHKAQLKYDKIKSADNKPTLVGEDIESDDEFSVMTVRGVDDSSDKYVKIRVKKTT